MQTIPTDSLDRAAVERLSTGQREPRWLLENRLAALDRYLQLPAPTDRTEGWRRLRFNDLPFVQPERASWTSGGGAAGTGIVVCDIIDALGAHEAAIREAIEHPQAPLTLIKHGALAQALWTSGVFVYVGKGVDARIPIDIEFGDAPYQRAIVVLADGARATVVERHCETSPLAITLTDLIVGEGAHLSYAHVQEAGRQTNYFSVQRARIGRDAKLVTLNFASGGALSKSDVEVELRGQGAESDMLGVVFGEGEQQFDFHTLQGHMAPDTRSDLLYKNALDDSSHSIYTGVISIDKQSPRGEAYQANRNLLLSDGARADTQPKLEILIDDVARCTHGATVGPVDDEQLFYLRSRGIDPRAATRLIVEGFFQEVFQKFGNAKIAEDLARKVAPHIGRLGAA